MLHSNETVNLLRGKCWCQVLRRVVFLYNNHDFKCDTFVLATKTEVMVKHDRRPIALSTLVIETLLTFLIKTISPI